METLPDVLVSEILERIDKTSDRNAISLVSTRLHNIEAYQRNHLKLGCGQHRSNETLTLLCIRFPNLTRIEIAYSGWMRNMGKQLDNEGLLILSSHCPKLMELTLSFCSLINDKGMSNLTLCKTLISLKLNFNDEISSKGLLSVASSCKNISTLHLNRCTNVHSAEWLRQFGKHENLQNLSIKNCKGITQDDLVELGRGLNTTLKRLHFEVDEPYPHPTANCVDKMQHLWCDNLIELSLVNCSLKFGRPLRYIIKMSPALESLSLNMCDGLNNSIISGFSYKSRNLRKISLHLPLGFGSFSDHHVLGLNDCGLVCLALGCSVLEEFELSYCGRYSFPACFSKNGLLRLIGMRPLRVLVLKNVACLDDYAMEKISSSSRFLEVFDIEKCRNITDVGMKHVVNIFSLKVLKISKCPEVSYVGMKLIARSGILDSLIVEDCFQNIGYLKKKCKALRNKFCM